MPSPLLRSREQAAGDVAPVACGRFAPACPCLRRSFIYRKLQRARRPFRGDQRRRRGDGFRRPPTAEAARAPAASASPISRPCRAPASRAPAPWNGWQAQGLAIGPESNRGYRQPAGEVALAAGADEIFLIDSLDRRRASSSTRLNQAWSWGAERPRKLIGYPMPRADSHGWFALSGKRAPDDVRQDLRHRPARSTSSRTAGSPRPPSPR